MNITPEGMKTFARIAGYPSDVEMILHTPSAVTDWSYELVIVRGSLMVRERFTSTPSLGEIKERLAVCLERHEWLK